VDRLLGYKKQVGDKGEKYAEDFLKRKGYNIIQRNYRCKLGEIDIIAEYDNTIVFVEVRTKRTESFGIPQYSITSGKMSRITKTALSYIQEKELFERSCRFDVIAITFPQKSKVPNIEHIENAFELDRKYMY